MKIEQNSLGVYGCTWKQYNRVRYWCTFCVINQNASNTPDFSLPQWLLSWQKLSALNWNITSTSINSSHRPKYRTKATHKYLWSVKYSICEALQASSRDPRASSYQEVNIVLFHFYLLRHGKIIVSKKCFVFIMRNSGRAFVDVFVCFTVRNCWFV